MKFKKGKEKTGGRAKGVKNKTSEEVRQILNEIVSTQSDNLNKWIDRVAIKEPARAIELTLKVAEFVTPKYQRIETIQETPEQEKTIIVWGGKEIVI